MNILMQGFHPTFEALSARADQSDVEAARTRVGRHVARCATCTATIDEIRALGTATRAVELPGAPEGLWSTIERALTGIPDADPWSDAPRLRPTTHLTAVPPVTAARVAAPRRRVALALAAAVVVGAVLLVPSTRANRLQASPGTGRWHFSPARPRPGGRVTVRFEPGPSMRLDGTLLLLGGSPRRWFDPMANPQEQSGLADSLGVLVRQRDGAYAGEFSFPADVTALVVMLTDLAVSPRVQYMSAEGLVSRDPERAALLVTGDATGRPSLAALTTAVDLWTGDEHDPYRVPDTLIRYFPSEPIGYAADRTVGGHGLFADLVQYFKRGAGQYLKFDSRYTDRATVSADHEVAMIRFAARIDEPGERRKWTLRLAHDHPTDPRTLYLYSAMLSTMLTRVNTIDSVRQDLPLADSLWERSGRHGANADIASVSARVGDAAANRRWILRGILGGARNYSGGLLTFDNVALEDASIRAALVEPLRARIAEQCVLPAGKYPRWQGVARWVENCRGNRAWALASLSMIERTAGHPHAALALADSSLAVYRENDRWCQGQLAHRRRGEALLALHDTLAAAPELAVAVGRWEGRGARVRDSLGAVLRPVVTEARWNGLVAVAADSLTACIADVGRRERERRRLERQQGMR